MRQHGQMRLLEARRRDPVVLVVGIPANTTGFSADAVPKVGDASHDGSLGIPGHYDDASPTTRGGNKGMPRPRLVLCPSEYRQQDGAGTWGGPLPEFHAGT